MQKRIKFKVVQPNISWHFACSLAFGGDERSLSVNRFGTHTVNFSNSAVSRGAASMNLYSTRKGWLALAGVI
ncbi:MAG TPA: hypothetical protein VJ508_02755, partial [Saprospiraceae bacterium]|nr:hypothetical protein [Saprospiraceae bacterium]